MPENRKDVALLRILEAGENAVSSVGTTKEIKAFRRFLDCVKNELIYYLFPSYDAVLNNVKPLSRAEREKYDVALEQYSAVISDAKLLENVIYKYDAEKAGQYGFSGYFLRILSNSNKKTLAEYNNSEIRSGITKVFSEQDVDLLKKIDRLIDGDTLKYADSQTFELVAKAIGTTPKKVIELISAKENSYCTYFAVDENSESGFETYDAQMSKAYEKSQIENREKMQEDADFINLLLALNELYHKSFTERDRFVFPPAFTGNYIDERASEVERKMSLPNRAVLIEEHFDELQLPLHCSMYADGRYVCMLKAIFDYSIDKRTVLKGKQIAEMIGVSPSVISKTVGKVYEKLKEKV